MTYINALGLVVYGILAVIFVGWYLWCIYTMFFVCRRPVEFFSTAYSTSGPFAFVNIVGAILLVAAVIYWSAN